jgi:uncharacterized membrane protein
VNNKVIRLQKFHGLAMFFIYIFVTTIFIYFNVPILMQIAGFVFLTIIPGWLIVNILRLEKQDIQIRIVLIVALSILVDMLVGLAINYFLHYFHFIIPLTEVPLLISFNFLVLILSIIVYVRNKAAFSFDIQLFRFNIKENTYLMLPAVFPLLSVVGMRFINNTGNNIILLILFILIPIYVIFIAFKNSDVPPRVYPLIIFFISISIVLVYALLSNHIYGSDSNYEYYVFQKTLNSGSWEIYGNSTLDSCLSISILPTIYQCFMKISPEYLFKLIYVIPFAMTPVIAFIIYKKYIGNFYAFLASFFLISQAAFFSQTAAYRNYLAIFFFGIAILIMFIEGITELNKKILFICFSLGIIVSHYATSYIFLFLLLFTFIGMQIYHKYIIFKNKTKVSNKLLTNATDRFGIIEKETSLGNNESKTKTKFSIDLIIIFLIFMVLYLWYSQITGESFSSGVNFIYKIFINFKNLFTNELRAPEVVGALGNNLIGSSIIKLIGFATSWISVLFIGIGVLFTLIRYKNRIFKNIDIEIVIIALFCSILLITMVVLPYVSIGYSFGRAYYQCALVLSPFFIIGGIVIYRFVKTQWRIYAILIILILNFLFNSETIAQFSYSPTSPILNIASKIDDYYYIYDSEAFSAHWVSTNIDTITAKVYTDYPGKYRLTSIGQLPADSFNFSRLTINTMNLDGYIYLRYDNVIKGKLMAYVSTGWIQYNTEEFQFKWIQKDLIYNNNSTQIWH